MADGVARFVFTDASLGVATRGDATGGEAEELEKASGADARKGGVLLDANRTWIEAVLSAAALSRASLRGLAPFHNWKEPRLAARVAMRCLRVSPRIDG
jgi:hypothetical protein